MSSRVLVVAVLLPLALAGCIGEESEPLPEKTAPNGAVFNSADVEFAGELLLQRSEELALVNATVGHDLSPELNRVLDDVRSFRTEEVTQLTIWLTDWEQEIPSTAMDHEHGHDVEVPAELDGLEGEEFEQTWVALFLDELHDVEKITESETEKGANEEALRLAQEVAVGYDDETDALEDLL